MNKTHDSRLGRSAWLVGLIGCAVMAGCVVTTSDDDDSDGSGAGDGAGGGKTTTSTTSGTTTTSSMTTATSTSTGGACLSCGEFLVQEGDLCPASQGVYDALVACSCEGACMFYCESNICMGLDADMACEACIVDIVDGCGDEYAACNAG